MQEIITYEEAKERGLKKYFTGKPCKNGHISERYVSVRRCAICVSENNKRWLMENPEKSKEYSSRDHKKNKEKRDEKARQYRVSHREEINEKARIYRSKNPEKSRASVAKWRKNNPEKIKAWEKANPESLKRKRNKWNSKNGDRIRAVRRIWYHKNKENLRLRMRIYQKENRHIFTAGKMRWVAAKLKATPLWADHVAINMIYKLARETTIKTGIPHHVDHIVPLQGKTVCGLHVENNLQVLAGYINSSKQNRYWPDM